MPTPRTTVVPAVLACLLLALAATATTADPVPQEPCPEVSTDDAWDVAAGVAIVDDSGFGRGVGANMFGAEGSSAEGQTAFFADGNPDGFVAHVEWTTPAPVTIRSFSLLAAHDGNSLQRSFSEFRLYAIAADGSPILLYEYEPDLPYGGGELGNYLMLCDDIPSAVEASRFRAEFTQNGGFSFPGTRIGELDGYEAIIAAVLPTATPAPTPEPTPTPAPTPEPTPEEAPTDTPTATPSEAPAEPGAPAASDATPIIVVVAAVLVLGALAIGFVVGRRRNRGEQRPG